MEVVISIFILIVACLSFITASVIMLVNFHRYKREAHDPYNLSKKERELLETSYRWVIAPKVLSRDECALRKMIRKKMKCVPASEDIERREEFLINKVFPLVLSTNTGDEDDHVFRSFKRIEETALKMERGENVEYENDTLLSLDTHGAAMRRLIMYGLVEVNTRWNYWVYKRSPYGKLYLHQEERSGLVNWIRWVFSWIFRGD